MFIRRLSRAVTGVAGVLVAAVTVVAAEPPYMGRWRLNPAKSDWGGVTMVFAIAPPGQMRRSINGGPTYTFTLDGRDTPIHSGYSQSVKQIDDHTWQAITKLNGKVLSTDRTSLSSDGRTLVVRSTGTQPDGKPLLETVMLDRRSGTSGLIGGWTAKNLTTSEQVLELASNGADGVTIKLLAGNVTCNARFDGKDYPLSGPTMPAGATLALRQTGPRSIEFIQKQQGKTIYASTLAVSDDGRALTEAATAGVGQAAKKLTKVYDRQ